jgi:uncharacterized damage-inducible protein DinB
MSQPFEDQNQIITRYAAATDVLEAAIRGLDESQLDLALSADSWSIRQIVHHLADGDYLWKEFILRAAGNPEYEFSLAWYWCIPQDDWAQRWEYAGRDIAPSLALMRASRQHAVELLKCISGIWEKSLPIPRREGGQQMATVAEVVEMQARHVDEHVEEIHKIRLAHGV